MPGAVWGLLALGTGMVLGTFFPGPLSPVGDAVGWGFRGLAKAAPYIIFFTIAAAIIDMLRTGKAGRFALWVSIVFTVLGLLAGFLAALISVPLFSLEWGFDTSGVDVTLGEALLAIPIFLFSLVLGALSSPLILLDRLLPFFDVDWAVVPGGAGAASIVDHLLEVARSTPSFIAVFYAIFCAVMLNLGTRARATAWFCRPTMDTIRTVGVQGMAMVGKGLKMAFPYLLLGIGIYVPSAIGTAVDASSERLGGGADIQTVVGNDAVSLYFLTVWIQVVALAIFIFSLIFLTCWWCRFSLKQFFKDYFLYVYPFAWGTSSSAASIPVNLERTGSGLKVRKEVREFIIPLGATVNLDGAIMACFIITTMASIIVGYRPTFVDLMLLLIPIKIVTLGVPGIPGGIAAVVPPVVAGILPLPPGSEATFLAIWFAFSVGLSDQFRTGVNTTTNGIVSMWFEKVYDRWFARKDGAPAGDPGAAAEVVEKPA